MSIQLYGIEHPPVGLPIWQTLIDDLANPAPARVARVLGISERSVYRYNQTGVAPRVANLALFWLTRWGRSSVHAQATNDAIVAVGYAECLRKRVIEFEHDVGRLRALGHFGAANDPLGGRP